MGDELENWRIDKTQKLIAELEDKIVAIGRQTSFDITTIEMQIEGLKKSIGYEKVSVKVELIPASKAKTLLGMSGLKPVGERRLELELKTTREPMPIWVIDYDRQSRDHYEKGINDRKVQDLFSAESLVGFCVTINGFTGSKYQSLLKLLYSNHQISRVNQGRIAQYWIHCKQISDES